MKKSREEYRAWICSIRKRCGMDLDEFGASLCHYVRDRTVGEEVCRPNGASVGVRPEPV